MTNFIHDTASISNIHPADALADIRAEIRSLQIKEGFLRGKILDSDGCLKGDFYEASVTRQKVMKLDQEKLEKALGDLTPYKTENEMVIVRVKSLRNDKT